MKKALLFGATGHIGSYLLNDLLADPEYDQVVIVVRNKFDRTHPKLKVLVGDFHSLSQLGPQLVADELFLALGTTKANTPDPVEYYHIDHDYPLLAAKFAKEHGAKSVFIVTAVGANDKSSVFYIRTKGEVERDLIDLDYDHTHIFRPSMIMGNRKENRWLERLLIGVFRVINPLFVGSFSKYKGIEAEEIAKAMIGASKKGSQKVNVYHWREMKNLISL